MKKIIVGITIAVCVFCLLVCTKETYKVNATVILNENGKVVFVDSRGMYWTAERNENWENGKEVILIMDTRHTHGTLKDDKIVKIKF